MFKNVARRRRPTRISGDRLAPAVLTKILNEAQEELLREERKVLARLRTALVRFGASTEHQSALDRSIEQLDEFFLLVIVGEFNSGKSAFINALAGSAYRRRRCHADDRADQRAAIRRHARPCRFASRLCTSSPCSGAAPSGDSHRRHAGHQRRHPRARARSPTSSCRDPIWCCSSPPPTGPSPRPSAPSSSRFAAGARRWSSSSTRSTSSRATRSSTRCGPSWPITPARCSGSTPRSFR